MERVAAIHRLVDEMVNALRAADVQSPAAAAFVQAVMAELASARVTRNPLPPGGSGPAREWQVAVELAQRQRTDSLLAAILALETLFTWLPQDRFWTEPEHRYFAERMWGTFLLGQEDAAFAAEDRCIVLLCVVGRNTTYPLHEHRIEEAYYVVSGHAHWSHDGEEWRRLPPGSVFFNHSHEPHAIRTDDEPLLFLSFYLPPFGWEGGLVEGTAHRFSAGLHYS